MLGCLPNRHGKRHQREWIAGEIDFTTISCEILNIQILVTWCLQICMHLKSDDTLLETWQSTSLMKVGLYKLRQGALHIMMRFNRSAVAAIGLN